MNKQEVGKFLTLTSLIDNRSITAEAALMWAELLGDTPYDAAVEAMQAHYRESEKWLMPAHVLQRVKSKAKALEPSTMSPERIDCDREGRVHRWLDDDTCMLCTRRR